MRNVATKLIIGLLLALVCVDAAASEADDAKRAADVAYEALLQSFWDPARGDFRGTGNYWFYAHSIDIAVLAAERNPTPNNLRRIRVLYDQQAKRGFLQGAQVFFDDENWMALSLARASALTGDAEYLKTARLLFDDVLARGTAGRSEGVWWSHDHGKVATASNAGPVITGLLLWRATGELRYREFAVRNYQYWLREMAVEPSGLVYDQILPDGTKDRTAFTYDQGLMIGAAVELFRMTRDPIYLEQARRFARYLLDNMKSPTGVMIEQICVKHHTECLGWKDVAQFKGIGVRYLVELAKEDPTHLELRDYLRATARALMTPAVYDATRERFAFEWDGSVDPSTGTYHTTNSAALALAAYATLF